MDKESELLLYREIISNSQNYLWKSDNDGFLVFVNPQFETISGLSQDEIQGKHFSEFILIDRHDFENEILPRLKEGESISDYEAIFKGKQKETIYLSVKMSPSLSSSGDFDGFVGIARDVSKKKMAEKQVIESHEMLEKLARLVPGVIYQYRFFPDGHTSFPYSSPGMEEIYEVKPEEVTEDASKVFTRLHPDDYDNVARAIQLSAETLTTFYSGEFRVVLPRQGLRWRWSQAFPEKLEDGSILWHGIILDITERKEVEAVKRKYEEQLNKGQRLESLGLLAGGIAHDFNNLMGGIFGYIEMARMKAEDEKMKYYLSQAMSTVDRAHALTHQLLTFAKGGAPNKKVDFLFPFVQESAQFALSGSNVSCCFDIQPDLGLCDFDKNQIGQVIDNLFINAKQAMPDGGTVRLKACNIDLSENEKPDMALGKYISIVIQDNGSGIPEENLEHIFDPFFSTKSSGHGLGLATCFSIISRHNGSIEAKSVVGEGTSFQILLPVTDLPRTEKTSQQEKKHKGRGTVLLMDDERVIREILREILESFGYGVISRDDGASAVEYFKAHNTKELGLKAVFLDLTVPGGMSGREAVEKIREINVDVPVFVVSGYSDDPIMIEPEKFGFTASLNKPFRVSQIAEMLNQYL